MINVFRKLSQFYQDPLCETNVKFDLLSERSEFKSNSEFAVVDERIDVIEKYFN